MIERALVQVQQRGRPEIETRALIEVLGARGLHVETFSFKRLARRQLTLEPRTLVAGDLDTMRLAFKLLELTGPFLPTYPESLRMRLGRRVWESTLGEVWEHVEQGGAPLFVKPRDEAKRFTGFVAASRADLRHFAGASRRLTVWCSEVLEMEAEFRAYVVDGKVASVACYAGEGEPPLDVVDACVAELQDAPRGYALDVATTASGSALVECNDGFGLGLYEGVPFEVYADLICARWEELVGSV